MNANQKGSQAGFLYQLHRRIPATYEQYEKAGEQAARQVYSNAHAQRQFFLGWKDRWSEPHAKDCQCDDCKQRRADIMVY